MTKQDLATFYKISAQAVGRWSVEKRKQKTVQALSGAEQSIVDLIADINKLAYIYDCQWLHGVEQVKNCHVSRHPSHLSVGVFWRDCDEPLIKLEAWSADLDFVYQLQSIKTKLEELVYGVQTVD